jgi:hypothetical protein
MELFHIKLNEFPYRKSKFFRLLIVVAIILALLAIFTILIFVNRQEGGYVGLILIWVSYFLIYLYWAWYSFRVKLYIHADEFAIKFKFGMIPSSSQVILWETIEKVRLGPTHIAFYKKTGRRKMAKLGWLPYSKVVEIKEKVADVCRMKNIPVEIADFTHY